MKARYQSYLNSPEWKTLRSLARDRAGNKCEMCGGSPDHVHHVKYPKIFKDDHLDNLVVACEACHNKLHGIRDELYYMDWLVAATDINIIDSEILVKLSFDPMLSEDWNKPRLLNTIPDKYAAQDIKNLFDGECFNVGKGYNKTLPLTHKIFGDIGDVSFSDFIFRLDNFIGGVEEKMLIFISPGPTSCPCKIEVGA